MESKQELISHLEELLNNEDVFHAKRELKHFYSEFEKAKTEKLNEEHKKFNEAREQLSEEEKGKAVFTEEPDPLDEVFLSSYRKVRFALKEREEQVREVQNKIFETKNAIIDKITKLVHEENIAKAFKSFNELKEEWKSAGLSSRNHEKELHDKHNNVVKEFFYNMNIYKALKEYDFEKNLFFRKEIIEKCRALMLIDSIKEKQDKYNALREKWFDAGPVSREDYERLHDEWKEIANHFHDQLGEYYDKLHQEQEENLEKKKMLLEKAGLIDFEGLNTHSKWQKKTKYIIDLQNEWKTIGYARRKENEAVWKEFRAVCDVFFNTKQKFYDQLHEKQKLNKEAKQVLIEKAEALKISEDWKNTTEAFIKLQREWKKIDPAHHRDEKWLWKKFRETCNYFFDKKKEHFSHVDEAFHENLKLKNALIEELEKFEVSDDKNTTITALKNISERWNAIGHVPFKDKDTVVKKYKEQLNQLYGKLKLDEDEKISILFQNKIDQMSGSSNALDSLYNEKSFLKEKIDRLHSDVIQFENNMGFINSKDNKLIERLQKSVDKTQHEIDKLELKVRLIQKSIRELEKGGVH